MTAFARRACCVALLWLLAGCTDPGCLRQSECGKGFECRDYTCQRVVVHDAGPTPDGEVAPPYDAATEAQYPDAGAAFSGE